MHTSETTNGKLVSVQDEIKVLIGWADADAQHAAEHDAPDTAEDDRARARILRKALALLEQCER